MNWINQLARPEIVAMKAYKSARSLVTKSCYFLDANENPFDDPNRYNRYPKQQPNELLLAFSNLYQVDAKNLLITRGSDEGIDILIRTFCRAYQDQILFCPPTYGMYEISAQIQGISCIKVPSKPNNFDIKLDTIIKEIQPTTKLIFLCSPNNPTGNLLNKNDIYVLCKQLKEKALIVIDEAYIEFSSQKSLCQDIKEFPNLIVLRTLSKAYGLAGMRSGALIAHEEIIQLLRKVLAPYPIPQATIQIVLNTLQAENIAKKQREIDLIKNEREKIINYLNHKDGEHTVFNSETNFILMRTRFYQEIYDEALKKGVVLRIREPNAIRISVGTPEQNQMLMEILDDAL